MAAVDFYRASFAVYVLYTVYHGGDIHERIYLEQSVARSNCGDRYCYISVILRMNIAGSDLALTRIDVSVIYLVAGSP